MATFIIQPHGRLQEWIADENGYSSPLVLMLCPSLMKEKKK